MKGHKFFADIKSKTNIPFVAAINGAALGGGLEWAMYCDYRIATTSKKTVLGLPEVKLGLLPGMGGTYHLPKLIGYKDALDIIITGKNVRPDKAKKLGLVDLVVDAAALETVAITQAKGLAAGSVKKTQRKTDFMTTLLEGNPIGRSVMFDQVKKMIDKNTNGKYPSPYAILDVISSNYGKPKMQALEKEATEFAKLAATPESASLIGIFLGMSAVKKHDFGEPKSPVKTVAVLGAGLMGAGIAEVSADIGKYRVLLKDKDAKGVGRGEAMIDGNLRSKLKKKKMTNHEYCLTNSRIIPLHDEVSSWKKHFQSADIVIEAVFEDLKVKHNVIQAMEEIVSKDCVIATNTSAIPITMIAKGAKNPERVIGMHYFSPVPMMPLLEIITHPDTAPHVVATAMEVGSKQGKTPILVKDVPGFYVNRCLAPYMVEVTALAKEGVKLELLDHSMKEFGMPVGPITLCDEVGIDVSNHVGKFMSTADLGDRMLGGDQTLIATMVEKGWLGRKSGKGFYLYPPQEGKGKKKSASGKKQLNPEMLTAMKVFIPNANSVELPMEEIQQRLISRFINEAAYCLQDGIIRNPVDGDIGAVFGIGFPPFLGGPFRLLDSTGTQKLVDKMLTFRDRFGPQFEPCQLLKDYAASGKKFHP
jgi:enoyl-CoA hydratase / long-chain 3-hydroxyacyl-CoA dehydrogenase